MSPDHVLSTVEKPLVRRSAWVLFRGIPTYGKKDIDFGSFYELKK